MMNLTIMHLENVYLFKDLTRQDLIKLVQRGKLISVPRGTAIISEDSRDKMVYAILSGRVDIHIALPRSLPGENADGRIVATLKDGDTVGEMELVGRKRRSATVKAKDDVQLACWDPLVLQTLFEEDYGLGFRIMKQLARSLGERLTNSNMVARNI